MLSSNVTLRTQSDSIFRSHEVTACTELHVLLINHFSYLYSAEIKSIGQVGHAEFEYDTQNTIQSHLAYSTRLMYPNRSPIARQPFLLSLYVPIQVYGLISMS